MKLPIQGYSNPTWPIFVQFALFILNVGVSSQSIGLEID
jgi:hypothetical protein